MKQPVINPRIKLFWFYSKYILYNLVYQATVVETTTDGAKKTETYVGCCGTDFKTRKGNHNKSFKHERYKSETVLSSHI